MGSLLLGDDIERAAEWARCSALPIAAERAADHLCFRTMLERYGESDGCVARAHVSGRIAFSILDENLRQTAVRKTSNAAGITEARDFDLESLGTAPVW
jgi:hypothetical protein